MDTINTTLLDAVCSFFFTEARRVAGQGQRQFLLRDDAVDEFTDHGVLAGSDQVQILALDFVHHGLHLSEAHNTVYDVAVDHERRYAVGKSSVDHEISCIRKDGRVEACNVAHQIIESVSCNFSCCIQIDSVEGLHNVGVIRDFKIRYNRLAEALCFYVLAVIFSDRYGRIDDVRDHHHDLLDFFFYFFFSCRKSLDAGTVNSYLFLYFLSLFSLALAHQCADLFGDFVSFCTKCLYFLFDVTVFFVQLDDFINQLQFLILEFISDILFYNFRVFS